MWGSNVIASIMFPDVVKGSIAGPVGSPIWGIT